MIAVTKTGGSGGSGSPPFDHAGIAQLFQSLAGYPQIALAVSGGADSTALMLLAHRWAGLQPGASPQITILTVDHRLRPEAQAEAVWVAEQAARLGFAHRTLVWTGDKPKTGLQAAAREARYRLMAEFCHAHAIPAIATAHTRDDQAETLLMRLARGSGVDGLSGTAAVSRWRGLALLRPLLAVSRARLEAFLRANDQPWLEDPTNLDDRYERVRIRKALQTAEAFGLARDKLALTARRMDRARNALEASAADFLKSALAVHEAGFGEMAFPSFLDAPEDIALRALGRMTLAFGGREVPPPLSKLEVTYGKLREAPGNLTLGGCQLGVRRDRLLITREYGRMDRAELPISPGEERLWDHRFKVRAPATAPKRLVLRPFGPDGLTAVKAYEASAGPLPRAAVVTLPSLWRDETLVFVPFLVFERGPPDGWIEAASAEFANHSVLFAPRPNRRE